MIPNDERIRNDGIWTSWLDDQSYRYWNRCLPCCQTCYKKTVILIEVMNNIPLSSAKGLVPPPILFIVPLFTYESYFSFKAEFIFN